ncbi:MAG TPA: hypothetical protein PLN52_09330 [Opitutaceae bacterium]|nr:hypothetical protein [Opitutaceae bacterium]
MMTLTLSPVSLFRGSTPGFIRKLRRLLGSTFSFARRSTSIALASILPLTTLAPVLTAASSGSSESQKIIDFDIPSASASQTLKQYSAQAGLQVLYANSEVANVSTNAVKGSFTAQEALNQLLKDTPLVATRDQRNGAVAIGREIPRPNGERAARPGRSGRPENSAPAVAERTPPIEAVPADRRDDLVQLSPFQVDTDKDDGFAASNAGTATRMSLEMRDVPAPYSVMTREFIDALSITNVAEAASWMPNGAAVVSQDLVQQPMQFNTRGTDNNSGQQRNNYLTSGLLESYALERYEFGRGPNAALFNIGGQSALSGGLGAQTKRPRYDRSFQNISATYGSWDYKRSTLDVNQSLNDRLALRMNAVWFDRNGWRMLESEKTKGITAAGAFLLTPKTEIRVEGAYDKTARNIPSIGIFDNVSGWDGVTVFRGPISDAVLGTQSVPGIPNSFGQVLRFQGEAQGVNRRSAEYYVWDPHSGQNMIMNYQNEGFTRRADSTVNVPILANGVLYTRGTGLPFGNGGTGIVAPTATQNANDEAPFRYQINLPNDRFDRAINGSAFRIPSKRFTLAFDEALYTQDMKDANIAISHQIGQRWFFEAGADVNKVYSKAIRDGGVTVRTIRIDINQLLPNGAVNPNYLQPYGDAPVGYTYRNFLNKSVRANIGHRLNAGKWGEYVFNLNVSSNSRTTENRNRKYSVATLSDPRMWQSSAQVVVVRQYWNSPDRPYGDSQIPTTLSQNVFSTGNASYTTTQRTITPRWVMADWNDTKEKFDNAVLAIGAKYFGGRLAVLAAARHDKYSSQTRSRLEYGDLPSNWDGATLLYKPTAPADWADLKYLPRNATTGVVTSTTPVPAATRPRVNPTGVTVNNGVQVPNAFFANDRFRNDYSPPVNKGTGITGTYGLVYHLTNHISVVGNYATSYVPPPTNAFTLYNELVEPLTGVGYDGGLRFRFFQDRLTFNTSYFYNQEDHQRIAPPTTASINNLLSRNAATDPSPDGRNIQGLPDIFGTDYQSAKTSGVEFEIVGKITRGWRVMFNLGTAEVFTYNRYPMAKTFVPENADFYRQVLEDAGGRLDTTQRPNGAPGLAVINPNVTAAIASEQSNAVIDYNNIWANYATVQSTGQAQGNNRVTINTYSDYTIQTGRLKGLRFGLGLQVRGRDYVGSRSADTIVDPNNPLRAIDDPTVGQEDAIYAKRPPIVTATFGYSLRLKNGWRVLQNKEMTFQLTIRNLLNDQSVVYNGYDVIGRPPNGDFTQPNRISVTPRNSVYTEPISFLFTTSLKL